MVLKFEVEALTGFLNLIKDSDSSQQILLIGDSTGIYFTSQSYPNIKIYDSLSSQVQKVFGDNYGEEKFSLEDLQNWLKVYEQSKYALIQVTSSKIQYYVPKTGSECLIL